MPASRAGRWAFVFLALAAAYECFECARWSNTTFYVDKDLQVVAAQSLLAGRGLTLPLADPRDLSKSLDTPLAGWPPGYALLMAPALATLVDPIEAATALEILTVIGFFAVAWLLLKQFPIEDRVRLALCAWWAAVGSPLSKMGPSDMLSLTFFSAALVCGARILDPRANSWLANLTAAVLLALAAMTRFAYWPLLPTVLAGLMWLIWQGRSELKKHALIHLMALTVAGGGIALYQALETNHSTYLTAAYSVDDVGFFPEQLTRVIPFPAGVLGLFEPYRNLRDGHLLPPPVEGIGAAALWLASAALVWLMVRQAAGLRKPGSDGLLFVSGSFAGVTTLAMLLFLTVRYRVWTQLPFVDGWVHAQELRYYAPAAWVILLSLGTWLTKSWPGWSRQRRRAVVGLALAVGLGPFAIRARRVAVELRPTHVNSYQARWKSDWFTVRETVGSVKELGDAVVYADADAQRRRFAALSGATMADPAELDASLGASQPVTLLAALPTGNLEFDRAVTKKGAKARELADAELWLVSLQPGS